MGDLNTPLHTARETLGKKTCESLLANGYKSARYAATAEEAAVMAFGLVPDACTVGVPGTVTVRQLGLIEKLQAKKCTVWYHWDPALKPEDRAQRFADENAADWFITSSNAMTRDGRMVNIDGTGNRVAAMAWSPGKILYIVSVNKIEPDLDSAIARARNRATPPNVLRLGGNTPCIAAGHCVDCNAPNRVCRVLTIVERAPFGREAHAILVGEDLGY